VFRQGVSDTLSSRPIWIVAISISYSPRPPSRPLVFLCNGKGSFAREKMPPPAFPGACRGAHVELADLDGDGRNEVVASFSDEPDQYGNCPSDGGMTAWKASPRTGARQP
jgi:hypothetical protein